MSEITSMERVLKSLSFQEPDRVPLFLLLTMHGAKELGMTIREYFSSAENVVRGQILLRRKYDNDCYFPFFYAGREIEALGGDVVYSEDGPPNAGEPIIKKVEDIERLAMPDPRTVRPLQSVLKAISALKEEGRGGVPVLGVVISPFSLPVMQMGFERYLDILYDDRAFFDRLMRFNKEFSVRWANAQVEAGATAICYFDPLSSPSITDVETFKATGYPIAKEVISRIKAPVAMHFASGLCMDILDLLPATGTVAIGFSALENIPKLKEKASGLKLSLIGNLNGVEMISWDRKKAEETVRRAIEQGAKGGGFVLSDNHGEIPFQVSDEVLKAISEAVHRWGEYPLSEGITR